MKTCLGEILIQLMNECDIDDAKLSRETGIPASSISRIRLNPDANPTASTLRPLAKFFDISISQLLGDEPLPIDRLPGTHNPTEFTSSRIPLLEWDWINEWVKNGEVIFKDKLIHWISTEKEIGLRAFAVIINSEAFGITFRKGSLIIIDPDYEVKDGDLIILKISAEDDILLIRQFLKDGNETYIKSINPQMKSIKQLSKHYKIIGVIIETRFSLQSTIMSIPQTNHEVKAFYGSAKLIEAK